jgi:hypothetical protein
MKAIMCTLTRKTRKRNDLVGLLDRNRVEGRDAGTPLPEFMSARNALGKKKRVAMAKF